MVMAKVTAETIWSSNEADLLKLLETGELKSRAKEIRFYAPSFTYYKTRYYSSSPNDFPTISVTGTGCSLNCKHCGGKVLETMHPALSPQQLFNLCAKFKKDGAKGCLISGGCMPDGTVPLKPFIAMIKKVKRELGLTVFVHTGIIDAETAVSLKKAGVDATLIDTIGSDETIKKIFNLNAKVKDYAKSLLALQSAGLNIVPHVIVGLNEGHLDGEYKALEMISQIKPAALVIIAFMPIHGTLMAKTKPPRSIDTARVAASARLMFPETPIVLGCMRPKGKARAEGDVLALKAGVDAIAFPSEEAIEFVKKLGAATLFSSFCCAQLYADALKNG